MSPARSSIIGMKLIPIIAALALAAGGISAVPAQAAMTCTMAIGCPRPPHPGHSWKRQAPHGKWVAVDTRAARHVAGPKDPRISDR